MISTFLLTLLINASAFASIPLYFWDNQDGFVSAENCSVEQTHNHRFRISTYSGPKADMLTENIRNFSGVRQSHLINGSLIKLIDGKKKRDFNKVEIIGVNKNSDVEANRWFSQRLDQGYLYYGSVLPAEDYIIRLVEGTTEEKMGSQSVKWMYFKLAAEGTFYQLNCPQFGNRKYVLFKAYKKHSDTPSALVGVYWDESKLFKHIKTLTKYEAISVLPNNLTEVSIRELLSKGIISNTEDIKDEKNPPTVEDDILNEDQDNTVTVDTSESTEETGDNNVTQDDSLDGMKNIVCTSGARLNVRDDSLDKVIFTANRGEQVKIFQGWGNNSQTRTIDDVDYVFKKVQFADREGDDQTIGWVAYNFIKPQSKCKFIASLAGQPQISDTKITGLDDPNCCEFPTVKRPTHRYDSGMRKFRSGRSSGKRLHAACDLYRFKSEPILSVAPGKVIRDRYYFYQGTYAIEVVHSGGFVVRYGELDKKSATGVSKGTNLKMGQRLGYMGKVNSNCCRPMLHFELYEGTKTGPLSQKGNKFMRRSDLLDPTKYLYRWEQDNF